MAGTGRRSYVQREGRLVTEWVTGQFPAAHVAYRVRLGAIDASLADSQLTERELRAIGIIRRYVDALVITARDVHLVEGKILEPTRAIVQLDLYERLFPLTPGYEAQRTFPIVKHLVWVIPDPVVEQLAHERGILVHAFHPAWVDAYLAEVRPNERTATHPAGLLPFPGGT